MSSEREEAVYWKEQVLTRTRGELDTVQKAAAAWTALFTAALGIFGTVTFAGGLTTLEDLGPHLQPWVKGATLLAAIATLVAIVYASRASGTMPKRTDDTTWQALRTDSEAAAQRALGHLHRAKVAGLIAATLVLVGSAAVLVVGPAASIPKVPTVIAVIDGKAVCGPLRTGPELSVGTTPLENVTFISVVETCPR